MTKTEILRVHLRALRFNAVERLLDLWNITVPIFLTTGIVAGCARFWWWVFVR